MLSRAPAQTDSLPFLICNTQFSTKWIVDPSNQPYCQYLNILALTPFSKLCDGAIMWKNSSSGPSEPRQHVTEWAVEPVVMTSWGMSTVLLSRKSHQGCGCVRCTLALLPGASEQKWLQTPCPGKHSGSWVPTVVSKNGYYSFLQIEKR